MATEKYLTLELHEGLCNQIYMLMNACTIAKLMNRTLIIPQARMRQHALMAQGDPVAFGDMFDLEYFRANIALKTSVALPNDRPLTRTEVRLSWSTCWSTERALARLRRLMSDTSDVIHLSYVWLVFGPTDHKTLAFMFQVGKAASRPCARVLQCAVVAQSRLPAVFNALHFRFEADWLRAHGKKSWVWDAARVLERISQLFPDPTIPIYLCGDVDAGQLSRFGTNPTGHIFLDKSEVWPAEAHALPFELRAFADLQLAQSCRQFVGCTNSTFSIWLAKLVGGPERFYQSVLHPSHVRDTRGFLAVEQLLGDHEPPAELVRASYGGVDVTGRVRQMLSGSREGTLVFEDNFNATLGDPAPGVHKEFQVFTCSAAGSKVTAAPTRSWLEADWRRVHMKLTQGPLQQTKQVSPGRQIVSAHFGSLDVTRQVLALVTMPDCAHDETKTPGSVLFFHRTFVELFGDPSPRQPKQLVVKFTNPTETKQWAEWEWHRVWEQLPEPPTTAPITPTAAIMPAVVAAVADQKEAQPEGETCFQVIPARPPILVVYVWLEPAVGLAKAWAEVEDRLAKDNMTCIMAADAGSQHKHQYAHGPYIFISIGPKGWEQFPALNNLSEPDTRRWLHFDRAEDVLADKLWHCWIAATEPVGGGWATGVQAPAQPFRSPTPLVSVFTTAFNSGSKIKRPHDSLRAQTYKNWEWVIVDDSGEGSECFERDLKPLAGGQVSVFRPNRRSGYIGRAKRHAAGLCRGEILVEVDHDDVLTVDCLQRLVDAFRAHPECGFASADCCELHEGTNHAHSYGSDFAYGYGLYYRVHCPEVGRWQNVVSLGGINAKTMRHLVGLPNHPRAWTRSCYHHAGGHRDELSVADDYDLLVRTFLCTRFVSVPHLTYLQYRNIGGNQTFSRNQDIQILTKKLSEFYQPKVARRLTDLGLPTLAEIPSDYARIWTTTEDDPRRLRADIVQKDPNTISVLCPLVPTAEDFEQLAARVVKLLRLLPRDGVGQEFVIVGTVPDCVPQLAKRFPAGVVRWWSMENSVTCEECLSYAHMISTGTSTRVVTLEPSSGREGLGKEQKDQQLRGVFSEQKLIRADYHKKDVTNVVQERVRGNQGILQFHKPFNDIFGDPAPGTPKIFRILYAPSQHARPVLKVWAESEWEDLCMQFCDCSV